MTFNDPAPLPPEPVKPRQSAGAALRTYFLTGIIVVAPLGLTAYVVWSFIDFTDRLVTPYLPRIYNPRTYLPFDIPGVGLIVSVILLTLIGFLTANLLGRTLVSWSERLLDRMPVVRSIYGGLKQVFQTVLGGSSKSFREVVLVEYPRKDCWSIAFVASEDIGDAGRQIGGEDMIAVYVPTAPNPTSGYIIFLPRAETRKVAMTVEEGMKLVISGGVLFPPEPRA